MADATPTDDAEGQVALAVEGQEPEDQTDAGEQDGGDGQEPEPKTYSEDYVKRLRREQAQNRKKASELEARLREFEDRDKDEVQKLTEQLTAEKTARTAAESKLTRFEVAAEKGLDLQIAEKFLIGDTREEVEERADELTKLLAKEAEQQKGERNGRRSGGFDGGARTAPPEEKKPEEAHNDFLLGALGRKSST